MGKFGFDSKHYTFVSCLEAQIGLICINYLNSGLFVCLVLDKYRKLCPSWPLDFTRDASGWKSGHLLAAGLLTFVLSIKDRSVKNIATLTGW